MISGTLQLDALAGQHLATLPKPVRDDAHQHPILRNLLVTDAGYFPNAQGQCVERDQGSPTHLVIACLRGRGWYRTAERKHSVKPGDLVWLCANQPYAYGADPEDPWTIGWAHFYGEEAESWRKHIGFPNEPAAHVSHVTTGGLTGLKLEQIYLSLQHGCSVPDMIRTAILLRSALNLAAHSTRNGGANRSAADRIMAVQEHLCENLAQAHRLDELAAGAGLSVPHFCALFRRQTGHAPIDFLIHQRIQRACKLLDSTDEPIAAIAAEVGYDDAYYFTRCFRRIVGCPPRSYRRIPKN